MIRFVAKQKGATPAGAIKKTLRIKSWICVAVMCVAAIIYWPFMQILEIPGAYTWMYVAAGIAGIILSFHTYSLSILQAIQKYFLNALFAVSVNAIRLVLILVLVSLGITSELPLAAGFFAPIPLALLLTAWGARAVVAGIAWTPANPVQYRELIRFMLPLAALNVITILNQRIDIFMLQTMTTPEVVGAYGLAFQIAFVFPLVTSALFVTLLPKVSAMTTGAELNRYRKRILMLYPPVVLGTVAAAAIAPFFLNIVFAEKYASATPVLQILLLAFGMHIIFNPLGLIFYSLNRPHVLTIIHALQLPILVISNLLLIPRWGAVGATLSAFVIRLLGVVAMVVLSSRVLKYRMAEEALLDK